MNLIEEINEKRAAESEPFVLVQVTVHVKTCMEGCCVSVSDREPVVAQLSAVEAECESNTDDDISYEIEVLPWTKETLKSAMANALQKGEDGVAEYANLFGQLKKLVKAEG